MAEYNDYIPPEENPGEGIPESTIGPYDNTDERFYTTRLTPWAVPWGFSIGEDYDSQFGWGLGSLVHGVTHFASNAVAVAGKAIETVSAPVSAVAKGVGSAVAHVPIVGAPVSSVFSSAWNLATTPLSTAVAIAHGERIDHAVLHQLEHNLQDVHNIAQYASMVTSFVPGIGTGVSAAIGAGSALMNGQPIDKALVDGVMAAVPGGAIGKAAANIGYECIVAAKDHSKLDLATLSKTAAGAVADAAGIPPAGKQALMAGVTMVGQMANGVSPENAIPAAAIDGLPVDPATKQAMHEANDLAHALANGQPVDKAILERSDRVLHYLPVSDTLKAQVREAAKTGKGILDAVPPGMVPPVLHGFGALPHVVPPAAAGPKNPGEMLAVALKTGLADKLISSSGIPPQARAALTTGIALGTASVKQAQRHVELVANSGKLLESGIQLGKAVPSVAEGRRLVGAGHKGFDIGHGILGMRASMFDIAAVRKSLEHSPHDLKGFDMAVAQKIGLVTSKPNPKLSHAARAGYTMTVGMQTYHPAMKQEMMKSILAHPSASVGAKVAVHHIASSRSGGFFATLLRILSLGLIK